MIRAIDVANFLINLVNQSEIDDQITNLRINKLLYFVQGEYLAKHDKPLFEDDIEAWTYGPVIPNVYNTFKSLNRLPIQDVTDDCYNSVFTREDKLFLINVLVKYGSYSTGRLVEMTHAPGTPWSLTEQSDVIPNELIKDFFKSHVVDKNTKIDDESNFIGYRDEDNILVLPKEWDDD